MSDDFKNAEIMQESETAIDTDSFVFWYGELSLQLRQYKQAFEKQNAQFAKMNEAFQRSAQDMSVLTTENAGLKKADSETRKLLREKDVEIAELKRQVQLLKPQADRCSSELNNASKLVEQVNTLTTERNRLDSELKTSIQVREQQATQIQQYAQELQQQTMVIQSLEEQIQRQSEELLNKSTQVQVLEEQPKSELEKKPKKKRKA